MLYTRQQLLVSTTYLWYKARRTSVHFVYTDWTEATISLCVTTHRIGTYSGVPFGVGNMGYVEANPNFYIEVLIMATVSMRDMPRLVFTSVTRPVTGTRK